jgi:GMP reductase
MLKSFYNVFGGFYMKIEHDIKLDFNDVLIKPKRSMAVSRADVNLNRQFKLLNCQLYKDKPWDAGIPIIAANMDTVASIKVAESLAKHNCWTALHKFYGLDVLEKFFKDNEANNRTFYTLGTNDDDYKKLRMLCKLATPIPYILVDIANGYRQSFVKFVREIREWFPDSVIMAGNVCTPEMTIELLIEGKADCIKVGIGGGKSCQTRFVTHVGFPQLSAVIECADAAHGVGGLICSDGGIRQPGHVAAAFGGGADFVMIGGYFAGHDENEGEFTYDEMGNKKTMKFYGMSSDTAMQKHYGGKASYRASEGRTMEVPYKGSINNTIEEILGGVRSTCTYVGTTKLKDLSKCTTFIRVNRIHDNPSI